MPLIMWCGIVRWSCIQRGDDKVRRSLSATNHDSRDHQFDGSFPPSSHLFYRFPLFPYTH